MTSTQKTVFLAQDQRLHWCRRTTTAMAGEELLVKQARATTVTVEPIDEPRSRSGGMTSAQKTTFLAQEQWQHWRRHTTTAMAGGGDLGEASKSDNCDSGAY